MSRSDQFPLDPFLLVCTEKKKHGHISLTRRMDTYSTIINDEEFSKLTLNVGQFSNSLLHWEKLLNYLIEKASPINKTIEPNVYNLIVSTYESLLTNFPYLENYYVDYALLEYKLGHISKVHTIFHRGLNVFNQRSLVLWISYLRLCNDLVVDNKQLFRRYETAERFIGLHFYSGEFWQMYLEQLQLRCKTRNRYFLVLRKVLEIPIYSFSKFYAQWLRHVDEIRDLSQLSLFVSKSSLRNKLKIDPDFHARRGPYLIEAKKLIKKFTKELYMVVQYQVLEIYSHFESKLTMQYYVSKETLVPVQEIDAWTNYLDYTINLRIPELIHLNFQRALLPLANYDKIWLKYATWLIRDQNDALTARNVLLKGITMSLKKTPLLNMLYSVLVKLNDYDTLNGVLDQVSESFNNGDSIEESDDFEIFWDYIQYESFLKNSRPKSRYSGVTQESGLLQEGVLTKIKQRLSLGDQKEGQMDILEALVSLLAKDTVSAIESEIFKYLIESKLPFYLHNGKFWALYTELIFLDPSRSYLEKRSYIIKEVWSKIPKNHDMWDTESLIEICNQYMPEDIGSLDACLLTNGEEKNLDEKKNSDH